MLSSIQILKLAVDFASHAEYVDERVDSLIMRGAFSCAEEQAAWLSFLSLKISPFISIQIYDADFYVDLNSDEAFSSHRTVTISLVKPTSVGCYAFVFSAGAEAFISNGLSDGRILLYECDPRAEFAALGLTLERWNIGEELVASPVAHPINPRKFVREYATVREVPEDLSPWLLCRPPGSASPVYVAWQRRAARLSLASLVNSIAVEDGEVVLCASGPPLFKICISDQSIVLAVSPLQEAASWVFREVRDVEARHIIFSTELARAHQATSSLSDTVRRSLEAARTSYEAHVRSASRETLKALADLRKAVIEETQKITQKAQELAAALWRDIAVSASPFVMKVIGDAMKVQPTGVTAGFYFAAAAFVALSFRFQTNINRQFFDNQKSSREKWVAALYQYLPKADIEEIAERPISRSLKSYKDTEKDVRAIYILLAITLCVFGARTLSLAEYIAKAAINLRCAFGTYFQVLLTHL